MNALKLEYILSGCDGIETDNNCTTGIMTGCDITRTSK